MRSIIAAAITSFSVLCSWNAAQADQGESGGVPQQVDKLTTRQYNNRLPPVLPGEEVVTETGQKMRVWSSSGPVPVNPRPTPQLLNGNGGNGFGGVIVDGRPRDGKPPMPDGPGDDL